MIIYALAYPDMNLVGLLIAGVVPGILIAVAMAVDQSRRVGAAQLPRRRATRYDWRDYVRNTWRALPALVMPVLILGGIASGAFTPTEATVVAVFYALFAGRVIYRSLRWRMLPGILARSALMTASVLIIVAMSAAFAWVLTVSRVPQQLTDVDRRDGAVAARVPGRRQPAAAGVRHLHRAAAGRSWCWCRSWRPSRTRSASTTCSSASS